MAVEHRGPRTYWGFLSECLQTAFYPWEKGEALMDHLLPVFLRLLLTPAALAGVGAPVLLEGALASLPLFILGALAISWAPFKVWHKARTRVDELEESLRPELTLEPRVATGLEVGDPRLALAYIVIRNLRGGQVKNAYVKVHRILEHTFNNINKELRPYTRLLYEHQDVFLKWQATDERCHSFHTEAILSVARGRSGDGRYGLVSSAPDLFPSLQMWDWYEITLDVAADNCPLLQCTLILRMEEPIDEIDGKRVLFTDAPYRVEFREKEPTEIMPPPSTDMREPQPR